MNMRKLLLIAIFAPSVALAEPNLERGLQALAEGDYNAAIKDIQPLAYNGNSTAEFKLCGMYFMGNGMPRDLAQAVKWCKSAANHGNIEAMYNLGIFYQRGEGVHPDPQESMRWYKMAADRGHSDAAFNLALLENSLRAPATPPAQAAQPAPKTAAAAPLVYQYQQPANQQQLKLEEYCLMAAQRGNPDPGCKQQAAQKPAKTAAATAPAGVKTAAETAVQPNSVDWVIREANLGNLQAQNNLGVMYRRGNNVKKDPKEAFKWFEKAASKGSTKAMMNLASLYKNGEGTSQNLELAYAWYNLAADRMSNEADKKKALENVQKVSRHLNNAQIGNALNYVTKLDESIPIAEE